MKGYLLLRDLTEKALFQGTVYRYLGYGYPTNESIYPIKPRYNGIYVSWSQKRVFGNVLSKLYGTKTLLTCHIDSENYGINLRTFGVSKNEYEVVFPTIESTIVDIEYQYDDEDDE